MIDFHYWPTPNGWKVSIMLEECGLPYRMIPVNIGKGEQHTPDFLAISPNGRMPAIVDHDAEGGPLSIFESGAILLHLAQRAGRFAPVDARERTALMEWLFWQVGNLGPMAGQLSHYVNYAQGEHPYSHGRYAGEYRRCLEVLERRLEGPGLHPRRLLDRRHGGVAVGPHRQAAGAIAGQICPTSRGGGRRSRIVPPSVAASTSARRCGAPRRRRTTSAASCSTRRPDVRTPAAA